MLKKNFYSAFTLAEVLIVMGIIGIIAETTIPTLVENTQREELQVEFKKTYSELNQVSLEFKNDYGESVSDYCANGGWRDFVTNVFWEYFKTKSKISNFSWNSVDEHYTLKSLKGGYASNPCDVSGYYTELAGRTYSFNDSPKPGDNGPMVCVDINGEQKPNRKGWDFFIFIFTRDGLAIPMGENNVYNTKDTGIAGNFFYTGSKYCQNDGGYEGESTCAYYALINQSPEDSSKNYWTDFLNENK